MTPSVRLGVIGVGAMGARHAEQILAGAVPRCELTAVCSPIPEQLARFPAVRPFARSEDLIRSGAVDAVLIATPHYSHTAIGIDALRHGLHVLVEKPISVHKADAERLLAAHTNPRLVFAAMFMMRTDPVFQKIRQLVHGGDLGQVRRLAWTITNWFRPDAYYASAPWRGTWAGEGGGVLLNQCPHQLDLLQWFIGMPQRVRAFCHLGKYHRIEVEDDVTAYLEYDNGATATFITSTGEAPGANRLEIAGENGRLVFENGALTFTRNETPASEFSRTTKEMFAAPPTQTSVIPVEGAGGQHMAIVRNFVDAILDGAPLIAPAAEGIRSVELGNAMLLSSLQQRTVGLPMDGAAFEKELQRLIAQKAGGA
jgi:predicted dehydrogenase